MGMNKLNQIYKKYCYLLGVVPILGWMRSVNLRPSSVRLVLRPRHSILGGNGTPGRNHDDDVALHLGVR